MNATAAKNRGNRLHERAPNVSEEIVYQGERTHRAFALVRGSAERLRTYIAGNRLCGAAEAVFPTENA